MGARFKVADKTMLARARREILCLARSSTARARARQVISQSRRNLSLAGGCISGALPPISIVQYLYTASLDFGSRRGISHRCSLRYRPFSGRLSFFFFLSLFQRRGERDIASASKSCSAVRRREFDPRGERASVSGGGPQRAHKAQRVIKVPLPAAAGAAVLRGFFRKLSGRGPPLYALVAG